MNNLPKNWTFFEEIHSTNDSIHQVAQEGAPEGTTHLAGRQSQGRGRLGRDWWSPRNSSLLFTTLLRPQVPIMETMGLSLVAGVAAKLALSPLTSQPISLYWPNDLYFGPVKKLGGILCEMRQANENYWVALGMGINLDLRSADIPKELQGQTACLAELGSEVSDPIAIAQLIHESFWPLYQRFQAGETISELSGPHLAHTGERVTVTDVNSPTIRGTVKGLGPSGELLVEDDHSVLHTVVAGDVQYE